MRDVSRIQLWSGAGCFNRDNVDSFTCNGFQQLILSGLKIEYNGQLTHQGNHGSINVYNSSTTTLQNSGMCSSGNRRYYSFPVKIYFANITGSFRIDLRTYFYSPHNSFYGSAQMDGHILIHSSKKIISILHNYG